MGVFFNTVGIHMGTNCTPLLIDLFLYSETDLIQGLLKKNEKKLARHLNFMFRYIDDFISFNNSNFGDFSDHIYPIIPRIKECEDTKGLIRNRKLKKNKKYNKRKRTKVENFTQKQNSKLGPFLMDF
jgi:hypothetical protein